MEKSHLWEGEWLDDNELNARLEHLSTWAAGQVTRPLDLQALLAAVDLLSQQLKNKHGSYEKLKTSLLDDGKMSETEVIELLTGIAVFLDRDQLEKKLIRELGSTRPFSPVRIDEADSIFEAWAPLGVLVHVAPSNAASVAPLSVLEGLLSGNVNILKTSGSEGLFPPLFLKALFDCDLTGTQELCCRSASLFKTQGGLGKTLFCRRRHGCLGWRRGR